MDIATMTTVSSRMIVATSCTDISPDILLYNRTMHFHIQQACEGVFIYSLGIVFSELHTHLCHDIANSDNHACQAALLAMLA